MEHLASAYQAAGDFPKAIPIMEEIVRLRTAQAGASDSAVTAVVRNLATTYNEVGRHSETIPLITKMLEDDKAKKGPDHPDTIADMPHPCPCLPGGETIPRGNFTR